MAVEERRPEHRIAVWEPLREMTNLERRFRGSLGELFDWRLFPSLWPGRFEMFRTPSIEMVDKPDHLMVRVELPGMKREDIDVSVGEDGLTISGERKQDKDTKEEDYVYREHYYGTFRRIIPLPSSVQPDKVEAVYHEGILEVTLPKTPEAKPKKITISTKSSK